MNQFTVAQAELVHSRLSSQSLAVSKEHKKFTNETCGFFQLQRYGQWSIDNFFIKFLFFLQLMATINWWIILPLSRGSGKQQQQQKVGGWEEGEGLFRVFSKAPLTQKCVECLLSLWHLAGHSSPSWWLGREWPSWFDSFFQSYITTV